MDRVPHRTSPNYIQPCQTSKERKGEGGSLSSLPWAGYSRWGLCRKAKRGCYARTQNQSWINQKGALQGIFDHPIGCPPPPLPPTLVWTGCPLLTRRTEAR